MDRLAVELGLEIVKLVPGYVSTEVDIRASFDTAESLRRARRIIAMYEAAGVDRSRILIKLAGTWEGIAAARILEKEGITCNITLIFGFIQAVAAGQAGARLISPFPGRIKDWHAAGPGGCALDLALPWAHQGLARRKWRRGNLHTYRGPGGRVRRAHAQLLQEVRPREDHLHARFVAPLARHVGPYLRN